MTMIDHVSIGVRDVARSKRFYDAALKPLGYSCLSAGEESLGYGSGDAISLWVNLSAKPVPKDMASGLHFCFSAPSRQAVMAFHIAALAAGGADNGSSGLRADYGDNYYAAYAIDPDGHRIEAYCSAGA
jgi:catechol 2,3-dioxygenase-like lactoylglutathione lyase family enzyme